MPELLGSARDEDVLEFLDGLAPETLIALPWMFEFWALPHQVAPSGNWATWVVLGGRGAGKTRAGAEWVRSQVEGALPCDTGASRRVALVGETVDQVREVMIFGDSGILACSPPDRRPEWHAARKALVWPNGAEAWVYSASNPEALRGPQFDCAWSDELGKWKKGRETWDQLQFALRLGDTPRQMVTTTPRNRGILRDILAATDTVTTQAPTDANKANLAKSFLSKVYGDYAGTRLGRQELAGELLTDLDGALWTLEMLDRARIAAAPALSRVVVAVDPPASGHKNSDACGIVVAGVQAVGPRHEWRAFVLADRSVQGVGPTAWAAAAIEAAKEFEADRVVAEVNQGGDMVEAILRQQAHAVPYRAVHATRGKSVRAEPVAALYEQGRVCHLPGLEALEAEMALMTTTGFDGKGSPDRLDALVWAITDLMISGRNGVSSPQVRPL